MSVTATNIMLDYLNNRFDKLQDESDETDSIPRLHSLEFEMNEIADEIISLESTIILDQRNSWYFPGEIWAQDALNELAKN